MNLADLDAERALLGGLLLHPMLIPEALAARLTAESFAAPGHAAVFRAMTCLGPESIVAAPVSAVANELARTGDLGLAGGAFGVAGFPLDALPPSLLLVAAERLVVLAVARAVQKALREALARIEREPSAARAALATVAEAA